MDKIKNKINEFLELPNAWHYNEGYPPTKSVGDLTLSTCEIFFDYKPEIFPLIFGGIQIELVINEISYEIEIRTDIKTKKDKISLDIYNIKTFDQIYWKEDIDIDEAIDTVKLYIKKGEQNHGR